MPFTLRLVNEDLPKINVQLFSSLKKEGISENDSNDNIFEQPKHEYTRSLLDAMPKFQGLAQY